MLHLRKRLGAFALAVLGPLLLGGTCLADVALLPEGDGVKTWPFPNYAPHFPRVRTTNGVYIATSLSEVCTDVYEVSSVLAPRQGGHFSITVKCDSALYSGRIDLSQRKGSTWPKADPTSVPGDETWHSFSPPLPDQSITWNQDEIDNSLTSISGSIVGLSGELFVDKVNSVFC